MYSASVARRSDEGDVVRDIELVPRLQMATRQQARARELLAELNEPTLAALVRLLQQREPGWQVLSPSKSVPNQSPSSAPLQISVGEL